MNMRNTITDDTGNCRETLPKLGTSRRPIVLHATESYGGGVQAAIANYTQVADFAEHFLIARRRDGEDTGQVSISGFEGTTLVAGSIPKLLTAIRSEVRAIRPDVIHLHSSLAGLARPILPVRTKTSIVYSPHCYAFERKDVNVLGRLSYYLAEAGLAACRPQTTGAVSAFEARQARRIALGARTVVHLPSTCSSSRHTETENSKRNDAATGDKRYKVVTAGRIGSQKDPGFFARTAQLFRHAEVEWVWVGDGEESGKQLLREVGVNITGWESRSEVLQHLAEADVYLHTAAWEGDPLAPVEALDLGVPVVMRATRTTVGLGYMTVASEAAAAKVIDALLESSQMRSHLNLLTRTNRADSERALVESLRSIYQSGRPNDG